MFHSERPIFPRLFNGEVVRIKGIAYRAGFWHVSNEYEFTAIHTKNAPYNGAIRSEKYVSEKIKQGVIKLLPQ